MNSKAKEQLLERLKQARMHVLEMALVAFLEDILGRVPSDDEILAKSFHVQFSDTPLSTYARDGVRLTQYFVWDKEDVVAYGFADTKDLIALSIVRVDREDWPPALCAYIDQHTPNGGALK